MTASLDLAQAKVTVLQHPIFELRLATLRDVATPPAQFRRAMHGAATILVVEALRDLELTESKVQTPLALAPSKKLSQAVVLVPILRAGLGLAESMTDLLPEASLGHLGLYRDEKTLQPCTYFVRLPKLDAAEVVVIDPMLATGGTAVHALDLLKEHGATRLRLITLVSCREGIDAVHAKHPDVPIITGTIDPELNEKGYIVPGLGDAGDRYFGTFDQ
ncbi:MAG: uracil phosphoribosyltransferase [Verrucomicrobiales bacterium]